MPRSRSWWHDYSLSITLAVLFVVSWVAQAVTQWVVVAHDAADHGQPATWPTFWPQFLASTFENWQSEFLQLLTFVVLTAFLIHKGSHESKDTDEDFKHQLNRIEERLDRIEKQGQDAGPSRVSHRPTPQ